MHWLEVSSADPPKVSAGGARVVEAWRSAGCEVREEAVAGDAFWGTQEIVDVPELIECSVERVMGR